MVSERHNRQISELTFINGWSDKMHTIGLLLYELVYTMKDMTRVITLNLENTIEKNQTG